MTRPHVSLLIGIQFAGFSLAGFLFPFLPLYVQELGVWPLSAVILWAGILAAAGSVGLTFSGFLWSRLGHWFGLRATLVRALIGLGLAAILMGIAAEVWQLLLIRIVHGVLGSVGAVVVAVVTAAIPREGRASVLGWLQVSMLAGSVTGPVLGGLVLYWFGFPLLFGLAGGGALALAIFAFAALPAIPAAPVEDGEAPATPDQGIGRDPRALSLAVYFLALQAAAMMTGGLLVLYVQELGAGTATAPITGLVIGSSGALAGLAALFAARRRGRLMSAEGIGVTSALLGLLLLAQGVSTALGLVWLFRLGQGLTTGLLRPAAQASVQRLVDPDKRRAAYRLVARASTAGSIGGAILGGVVGAGIGLSTVFAAGGAVLLVGTATAGIFLRVQGRQAR